MANAVLFDILEQVRTDLQALKLPGLAAESIVVHKIITTRVADLPAEKFPCIVIAPWGAERIAPASNLRDDISYPVAVAILASERLEAEQPQDLQRERLNQYLQWRETIRKSFSNQRLSTTLCHLVVVEPLAIVDPVAWERRGLWASGLVLRCTQRESKG